MAIFIKVNSPTREAVNKLVKKYKKEYPELKITQNWVISKALDKLKVQ